ncbi:MAG: hypothetical protein IIC21_06045 [Chloroflexi bacterium]|nr:hypothetical protein [Chloroflexota bacterium]
MGHEGSREAVAEVDGRDDVFAVGVDLPQRLDRAADVPDAHPVDGLAEQVVNLPCSCVQVDEANIPGNPEHGPLAQEAINRILDKVAGRERAVHLCFGNYGGQTIQKGHWQHLINFLNGLKVDHLVLEMAHRPEEDLTALKEIDTSIKLGIGVVDVKINHIEGAEEIARRLEKAEKILGEGRVRFIHPDCGFWMLKRSVADRKMAALAAGRNLYLGISDQQRITEVT